MMPIAVTVEDRPGVLIGFVAGPMGNVMAVIAFDRRLHAALLSEVRVAGHPMDWPIGYYDPKAFADG